MAGRVVQVVLGAVGLASYVLLTPCGHRLGGRPGRERAAAGDVVRRRRARHRRASRTTGPRAGCSLGGATATAGLGLVALFDTVWPHGTTSAWGWLVVAGAVLAQDLGLPVWLDLFVVYPDGRYPRRWGRPLALRGVRRAVPWSPA